MNDSHGPRSEWLRQFDAMISQTATDGELAALYAQLEDSSEMQQAFLEYCQLHIDLSFELYANQACDSFLSCLLWADELSSAVAQEPSALSSSPLNPSSLSPVSQAAARGELLGRAYAERQSCWWRSLSWVSLPLVFLMGVLGTLAWVHDRDEPDPARHPSLAMQPAPYVPLSGESVVAQLVSNTGFVFDISDGRQSIELESGATLRPEQLLNIPQGIAQLAFSEGADLQLEGPVVLRIDSRGVPELRYGKIFAKAEWGVDGFAIETELGTIWLDNDDAAGITLYGKDLQIHGFAGEIDVVFKDDSFGSHTVSRGRLLRRMLVPDGTLEVSEKEYIPDLFTARFSIENDTLVVTEAYADMIRQAKPFCYWRFEQIVDGLIPNEMSDRHALRVRGGATIASVSPGNRVVEFGYGQSGGYLTAAEPLTELIDSDYTFETWVKPGHAQWGTIAALAQRSTDNSRAENHALILELTSASSIRSIKARPNSYRFLHRSTPGDRGGTACVSDQDYLFRKWQHVAAIKEGESMRLFVDGKPVAGRTYHPHFEDELELVIGQLFSFDTIRPLVGQIDEFAIYDRALAHEEVEAHYTTLRPPKEPKLDNGVKQKSGNPTAP
jgi:hypothetical protein